MNVSIPFVAKLHIDRDRSKGIHHEWICMFSIQTVRFISILSAYLDASKLHVLSCTDLDLSVLTWMIMMKSVPINITGFVIAGPALDYVTGYGCESEFVLSGEAAGAIEGPDNSPSQAEYWLCFWTFAGKFCSEYNGRIK